MTSSPGCKSIAKAPVRQGRSKTAVQLLRELVWRLKVAIAGKLADRSRELRYLRAKLVEGLKAPVAVQRIEKLAVREANGELWRSAHRRQPRFQAAFRLLLQCCLRGPRPISLYKPRISPAAERLRQEL